MNRLLNWFTRLYPVWLVGTAVLAFVRPQTMLWFSGQWIVWALSVSMLGMGFTLSPADVRGLSNVDFTSFAHLAVALPRQCQGFLEQHGG